MHLQATRPETLSAALSDSPVGLLVSRSKRTGLHHCCDISLPRVVYRNGLLRSFINGVMNQFHCWTSLTRTILSQTCCCKLCQFSRESLCRTSVRLSSTWPTQVLVPKHIHKFSTVLQREFGEKDEHQHQGSKLKVAEICSGWSEYCSAFRSGASCSPTDTVSFVGRRFSF